MTSHQQTALAAQPLNPTVLDALGRIRGRPDFVHRVIRLYLGTVPGLLSELKSGVADGEMRKLQLASHALKACGATIGAEAFSELCGLLEAAASAGWVSDAAARVREIGEAHLQVEAALLRRLSPREVATVYSYERNG